MESSKTPFDEALKPIDKQRIFEKGLDFLAPGSEISFYWDEALALSEALEARGLHDGIKVTSRYKSLGGESHTSEWIINPLLMGPRLQKQYGAQDVVKAIKDISKAIRGDVRPLYKLFQKSLVPPMLTLMRTRELTDEQWQCLKILLPPPRKGRGRSRAGDRKTLNGILYVLRTGCRWQDVPREYGAPATCWRRLKLWEEDGTWEKVWRNLLVLLDEQEKIKWAKAFLDGSFVPAKKGETG